MSYSLKAMHIAYPQKIVGLFPKLIILVYYVNLKKNTKAIVRGGSYSITKFGINVYYRFPNNWAINTPHEGITHCAKLHIAFDCCNRAIAWLLY